MIDKCKLNRTEHVLKLDNNNNNKSYLTNVKVSTYTSLAKIQPNLPLHLLNKLSIHKLYCIQ